MERGWFLLAHAILPVRGTRAPKSWKASSRRGVAELASWQRTSTGFHSAGCQPNTAGREISADEGAFQKIWLSVNNAVVEPLGLQQVIPQPDATKAVNGGAMYEFVVPPDQDDALVRFVLKPSAVGLVHADVGDGSGTNSLSWSQLILP
jgi:hypothetical protein